MINMSRLLARKPPLWVALVLWVVLVGGTGYLRLDVYFEKNIGIGYGMPIIIFALTRYRGWLWAMVPCFFLMTLYRIYHPPTIVSPLPFRVLGIFLVNMDMLLVTYIADRMVQYHEALVARQSELTQANQELSQNRDELARQGQDLQQANGELDRRRREAEAASIRKSRFLAAVSHDIRTPANAISLLAELIQRSSTHPEHVNDVPELAEELQRSSISLVGLISDVLDLTRLDAGRIDLHLSEFDLKQWMESECRLLEPMAAEKKLAFDCHGPDSPILLRTDRIKLARILTNLVGNAIKFTETGSVNVLAKILPDGRPEVSVIDTGIGIAPEHLKAIFDEYSQLKNPERVRSKGSGLGLSISKRLIEAMGGEILVQSEPGKGSTFTFHLPAGSVVAVAAPVAS